MPRDTNSDTVIDANESTSLSELEKVSRKATRMFTRRKFYKPKRSARYRELSPQTPNCLISACKTCERPCQGTHCRACFQKKVRAKYRAKVRADAERVRRNEAAYLNVTQREAAMTAKRKQLEATPITRSTSGLRTALFEEMEALRRGDSNAQRARSVAMMANSILQSVQVEIEYHKYVAANGSKIAGTQKVVSLGTDISLAA